MPIYMAYRVFYWDAYKLSSMQLPDSSLMLENVNTWRRYLKTCIGCLWKSESSTRSGYWHFSVWKVLDQTTSRRCSLACLTWWAMLAFDRLFVVTLSYPGRTLQLLVHGVFESPVQLFGTNYPLIWGIKTSHINNLRANWRLFCSSKPTGRFCNLVNGHLIQMTTYYYYIIIIINARYC